MFDTVTPESIKRDIASGITEFDTSEGSFADTLISPIAYKVYETYTKFRTLIDIFFMDTSDGDYVVRRCADYGIDRDMGAKATVNLTFAGTNGAVIPVGMVCGTSDGLNFQTISEATITSGSAVVAAQAEQIGAIYNVPGSSITKIITLVSGVSSVVNVGAASGGADIESIETLKSKWAKRFQGLPGSGNEAFYEVMAESIPGVSKAKAIGCFYGAGTVKVILRGEGNTAVDDSIVTAAASLINSEKSFDATVTVVSVEAVSIAVTATVTLADGILLADVQTELSNKISDYYSAFNTTKVYVTKIAELLSSCTGVITYSDLKLNNAVSDITITSAQVPKCGAVTLTGA